MSCVVFVARDAIGVKENDAIKVKGNNISRGFAAWIENLLLDLTDEAKR